MILWKAWKNDRSPGNDCLTKEFYVTFWDGIKATFISSLKQANERKELSISERQAIIKLIEKKIYFIVKCWYKKYYPKHSQKD